MTRLLSALTLALAAACAPALASEIGGDWHLVGIEGSRAPAPLSITFAVDGTVSGQAPCNRYSGTLTIDGTSFRPGPIAATRMACADLDGETAYFRSLEKVTTAERGPGRLTLSGDGHTLTFVQPID